MSVRRKYILITVYISRTSNEDIPILFLKFHFDESINNSLSKIQNNYFIVFNYNSLKERPYVFF